MPTRETFILHVIKLSRKLFRNTWVHRLPMTSRIYKRAFALAYSPGEEEVDFQGKKLVVNTRDTSMVPSIINQDYEVFELGLLKRLLRPGMVFFDIGANIGIYSIFAAGYVGKGGLVYAFEPVPENLSLLHRNIQLNEIKNIRTREVAISDKNGVAQIYLAEGSIGTHSLAPKSKESIAVKTQTLDNFIAKIGATPDFIKIDVEGYEAYALKGAQKMLASKKVIILMEFDADLVKQSGYKPEVLSDTIFQSFRYRYLIDERKKKLHTINEPADMARLKNSNLLLSDRPVVI